MHLLVYVALALSFVHQLAGPDLAGYRLIQLAWSLLYVGVLALVLEHRVITPLRNAARHRMRVMGVTTEGPDVVSIHVEGRALHELRAESGQFFRWRFLTPDPWRTAHPFSLSAPPSSTGLRLTVKTLGDGSRQVQHLEPGTWVVAEGPYGVLTAGRRARHDVLLVASGVGITPMRALFETLPMGEHQDLVLLYFARSEDDVLFRAELDGVARSRGVQVRYLTGDRVGPLDPALLNAHAPGVAKRDVYFCGPPDMGKALRRALRDCGLPDSQFHEERFAY